MIEFTNTLVYRAYMFFFVPFALVCLAFPGSDPLRRKITRSRTEKPTPVPAYLGLELGNKPYRAEVGPGRHAPHRAEACKRPVSHKRFGLPR